MIRHLGWRDSPETISQQVGPELQIQAQAVDAKVTAPNLKILDDTVDG